MSKISEMTPATQLDGTELAPIVQDGANKSVPVGTLGYCVVDELPATIPIGAIILYNGTMYRGLLDGESELAAGTPWPVKGYKEYVAKLTNGYDQPPDQEIIKTDIGVGMWALGFMEGKYILIFDDPLDYKTTVFNEYIYFNLEENVQATCELQIINDGFTGNIEVRVIELIDFNSKNEYFDNFNILDIRIYPPPPTP